VGRRDGREIAATALSIVGRRAVSALGATADFVERSRPWRKREVTDRVQAIVVVCLVVCLVVVTFSVVDFQLLILLA